MNEGRSYKQILPGYNTAISDAEFIKLQELAFEKHVLEIGSYKGYSAYRMAFSAARVDCVDPFGAKFGEDGTAQDFLNNTKMYDNIFLHVGRSKDIVPLFLPNFDLVFIDGDHTYNGVLTDLDLAFDKVKYGGVIALHDHEQQEGPHLQVRVVEALQDWLKDRCYFYMAATNQSEYHPPVINQVDSLAWFIVNWR